MRTLLTIGLVITVTASAAVGQNRSTSCSDAAARSHTASTLTLLNERINAVSLQEAPLDQTLEWLGGFTPLNVVVRWPVLEDLGVEQDTPITIEIHNLRLSQVLWLILREAGGTDVRLAYRVDPDLVIISSADDLDRDMLVRVYDVSDLLLRIPRVADRMQIDITQPGESGSGSAVSRRSDTEPESEHSGARGHHDKVERLIELITETIEPDSWVRNGGRGTIRAWGSLLVVRSSIPVHQALGGYVGQSD